MPHCASSSPRGRRLLRFTALVLLSCAQARGQGLEQPFSGSRHHKGEQPPPPSRAPVRPIRPSRFVEAWRAPLDSRLVGPLLAQPQRIVATLESGGLVALSPDEGKILWKREGGMRPVGGPTAAGPYLVQAFQEGKITALHPETGEEAWRVDLRETIARPATGTLEEILVPLTSAVLVSLRPDGGERWRVSLHSAPSTPPAACRGFAAVGTEGGTVEAFERDSGKSLWVAQIGSPIRSPLLCYQGSIYFGTADDRLWALKYSGRKKWRFPAGAECGSRPFGVDRKVFFPSFDDYLYALKARSGNLILRVRLSHRLSDDMLVSRDRVYFSPYTSARLQALSLPELILAGEYKLDLVGDWFTTPPLKMGDRIFIGYGRYEGRVLALKETLEVSEPKALP